jgi:hypothetical protein
VAYILFFEGFLLKSYWEDVVFERDTRRVLAFYRRAVPGSMRDGGENGARLWVRLEKKYESIVPDHWDPEVEEEMRIEKEARQAEAEARKKKKGAVIRMTKVTVAVTATVINCSSDFSRVGIWN